MVSFDIRPAPPPGGSMIERSRLSGMTTVGRRQLLSPIADAESFSNRNALRCKA
jgi:hypothetical protein